MHEVSMRVRTPEGVSLGRYHVTDVSSLAQLEAPQGSLYALEQALYAAGMMTNPFDVTEAVMSCEQLTYRYVKK